MKMEIWPDDVSMPEMTDWLAELRDEGRAEAADDGPGEQAEADEASPEVSVPAQADGLVSSDQASGPAKASSPGLTSLPAETGATGPTSLPAETGATGLAPLPAEAGATGLAPLPAEAGATGLAPLPAEAGATGLAPLPAQAGATDLAPLPAQAGALDLTSLPAETGAMDRLWPPAETGAGSTWPHTDTSPTGRIRIPAEASPAGRTWPSAEASSRSGSRPPARASAPTEITERAVIGDQLRMPIMWCEMGSCISWYSDPAALGEADIRARAIDVGWRVDALGRLACPRCQQTATGFRISRPVVLWDRHAAITRAARMAGLRGNGATGERGRDPRPPAGHRVPTSHRIPASPPDPERRRERPAAKTTTVGRHAR